ncbi:hypothetical protein BD309DRAFT_991362 [Dichomitus squalens]|uniref:Uncharacterized protein n=1 Tax=Dichomitus squalens TaxID=114155 RepID=A0A4Q9NSB7_9APHY|nr:hypothetical protein BD309DRAFT_991362 [Dichomitus squalens]TBU54140.1 hypothetical protein BD310DRAFT_951635 [Dichomitus squalens]
MNPNASYTVLEAFTHARNQRRKTALAPKQGCDGSAIKGPRFEGSAARKTASSLLHIRPCPPKRRCEAQVRTDERLWEQTSLYEPILAKLERRAEENKVRMPRAVACMHVVLENALIGLIKERGKGH